MSGTLTWDIPGCNVEVGWEELDAVNVQTASSQTEIRTAWGSTMRFRYTFRIVGRTNVSATNEVAAIQGLYTTNQGRLGSFSMTDPFNGNSVTARFDSTFPMRRKLPTSATGAWWEMTFSVIT